MKNAIKLFLTGCVILFVSCGPTQKELREKEQARLDSIRLDSISFALYVKRQDSLAHEARIEREAQDSVNRIRAQYVQDSIAKAGKGKKGKKK